MAILSVLMRALLRRAEVRAWAVAIMAVCVACNANAQADGRHGEDAVKAAFLYRFTGYVDWPAATLETPAFTIALLDAPEVAQELNGILSGRTIKGLPARARQIRSLEELGDAQMLYVGARHRGDLRLIARSLGARPVLLVTNDPRGMEAGAAVNFLLVDRRVRFEVSLAAAERSRLKFEVGLLSVAARVISVDAYWNRRCVPGEYEPRLCLQRMARL